MKKLTEWINHGVADVADKMTERLGGACDMCARDGRVNMSTRLAVYESLDTLLEVLFPGCYAKQPVSESELPLFVGTQLRKAAAMLGRLIEFAYKHSCEIGRCEAGCDCEDMAAETVIHLLEQMPEIHRTLVTDIQSAFEGDPAAISMNEIVLSYPFVEAIATHRLAHELYSHDVPLVPRIMAERAHHHTGIDIHPGAKIGERFFIDHGTGVVIGETCVIGNRVKIFQGVTLGALSIPTDERGHAIKGVKRHPNIEDDVTIYSGATILGGDTVVGRNSIIGGNVWLTHSAPAFSKIFNTAPKLCVVRYDNEGNGVMTHDENCP